MCFGPFRFTHTTLASLGRSTGAAEEQLQKYQFHITAVLSFYDLIKI